VIDESMGVALLEVAAPQARTSRAFATECQRGLEYKKARDTMCAPCSRNLSPTLRRPPDHRAAGQAHVFRPDGAAKPMRSGGALASASCPTCRVADGVEQASSSMPIPIKGEISRRCLPSKKRIDQQAHGAADIGDRYVKVAVRRQELRKKQVNHRCSAGQRRR